MTPQDAYSDRIGAAAVVALTLCIVACWMLQHPYEGVVHDSVLYAFSALARLHPESIGHDLFLTVGSQDRFTLFSPIAATAIHALGMEHAAALVTLVAESGFFLAGWWVARSLAPRVAILSAAALVMLPTGYGANHIFSYVEPFMTPRLVAEALVLACLGATLRGRHILSGACLLVAALIHPLMAAAGFAVLYVLYLGLPRPLLASGIAIGAFSLAAAIAWLFPFGPLSHFSAGWFNLLHTRAEYLFPSLWPRGDWTHTSVPLAVLLVGAITATQPLLRRICLAVAIAGTGGLVLALVGSDLLHIVGFTQLQSWRWLWLTNTMAALLTPVVLANSWRCGDARRVAALLLAGSWIMVDELLAPLIAAAAIALAAAGPRVREQSTLRLLMFGAYAVCAFGIAVLIGFVLGVQRQLPAVAPDPKVFNTPYLLALRHWKPWISGGVLPFAIILGVWFLSTRTRARGAPLAAVAIGLALCCAAAPFAWNAWTRADYPPELYARFAPWRAQIPAQAEVLWVNSAAERAFPVWYLLERPSYWSKSQTAAAVFSEEMARKLALREMVILDQPDTAAGSDYVTTLCRRNSGLGFFVTPADMGPTPFAPLRFDSRLGPETVRLYGCADRRS